MDLGLSGLQLIGGVLGSYAADAAVDNEVQTEETAGVEILEFVVPYHCEIIDFGVVITEDLTTQAVDAVVRLGRADTDGGTLTVIYDLTVGNSNTLLTKGDGATYAKDNQTAISVDTDLDSGDVIHADLDRVLESVGRKLVPGQVLVIEHQVASSGGGGAYVPFVLLKISGPDFTRSNVWRELRSGEAVLD